MTETTPEIAPEGASETAENAVHDNLLGVAPDVGTADGGTPEQAPLAVPADTDEDGVAIHILKPHEPGTILIAVAEPSEMLGERPLTAFPENAAATASCHADDAPDAVESLPQYADLNPVAAVRLSGLGPALFFTAGSLACAPGDKVVVEMEDGQAFGVVASVMRMNPAHAAAASGEDGPVRPVLRKATDKDLAAAEGNRALAAEALAYCRECIRDRELDMKLVDVLVLHDRSKMIFYFTAPSRIDFRELVKDLVRRHRTRIELRQIGVRHETQMVGALGNCGMVCCCRRYLRAFAPVAIKMAKEQNVFLNPVKISGICGRLLCCLAYEQGHYDEFYRSCPKLGKKYHTDAGVFRVLRASLFRESVTVFSETGEEIEYSLDKWNSLNPTRPNAAQQQQPARKQEKQDADPKLRKGEKRGGRPDAPTGRHEGKNAEDGEGDFFDPYDEAVIMAEDSAVVTLEGGRSPAGMRSAAVFDTFENAPDAGNPFEDDDGSIFGLAPRRPSVRENGDSGGEAARNGENSRRRPRRRRQRPTEA